MKPAAHPACARMQGLPDAALEQVAAYFQALSEPTRLKILNLLRQSERNVGELAQMCGYTSANISRHLSLLTTQGLVARESRGTAVYFRIADKSIDALCDIVCERIANLLDARVSERQHFQTTPATVEARSGRNPSARRRQV